VKKVAIVTSASGTGGTTVGRELAARLDLPFHELDVLFWQPNWGRPDPDEFRARVGELVATERWVIDGAPTRAGSASSSSNRPTSSFGSTFPCVSGFPDAWAERSAGS